MTSQEVILKALALEEDRAAMALRELASDDRFPAIIKLIHERREAFVLDASKPIASPHTGSIQHAMGATYALGLLVDDLVAQIPDPRRRRTQSRNEES